MEPQPIFDIDSPATFRDLALETFALQYREVPVYREFCDHLKRSPARVRSVEDIPFLPISMFKSREVLAQGKQPETVFQSSGTTGMTRSRHLVADLSLYQQSFTQGFKAFYGNPSDWCILALLPSYQQQPGSSLIYMADHLIRQSANPMSGYLPAEPKQAADILLKADGAGQNVLLIGVSYALLDLARSFPMKLHHTVVMETGGMKGRGQELVREALHERLCSGLGVEGIHSEYGMTELLSQAYSQGRGLFRTPPWMQVRIRDTEDPLSLVPDGKTGGIDIIDLANRYSCSFIATQDLGKKAANGHFEVLGRFDHSDIRGCNLLML